LSQIRLAAFFGLVALFLLLLLLSEGSREAEAVTYFIEADGSGDTATIQEAIDLADPKDEIQLGVGTFDETITITKEVNIRGVSRDDTILESANAKALVTIRGVNDIKLSGMTLRGYQMAGILLDNASGSIISDIKGQAEMAPVVLGKYSDSITIGNSAFYQCATGILLQNCDTVNIEGSYFIGCDRGIEGRSQTANVTISQTTFSTNNVSISCDSMYSVTISNNDDDDSVISVGLLRTSDVMIISNDLASNLDTGVLADLNCEDIKIQQNIITGSGRTHHNGGCISIFNSNLVTISGNELDSKSNHTIYLSNLREVFLSVIDNKDITLDEVSCREISLENATIYLVDSVFETLELDETSKLFVLNSLFIQVFDTKDNVVEGADIFIRDNGAPIYATPGYSNGTNSVTIGSSPFHVGSFRHQVYLGNTTPEQHEILISVKFMDWEESNKIVDLSAPNILVEFDYNGTIEQDSPPEPDDPANDPDADDDGGETPDNGDPNDGDEDPPTNGDDPEPNGGDGEDDDPPDNDGDPTDEDSESWFEQNMYYLLIILFALVLVFTYSITVLVIKVKEMGGDTPDEKMDNEKKPKK